MHLVRRGLVWVGLAVMTGISLPCTGGAQTPQAAPAKAQTTLVLPPGPLLPEKLSTWTRAGAANETTNIANSGLDGAKAFIEDGATRYATANYQPAAGGATVRVDAVQFGDVSGAYSAFTLWASKQGRSAVVRAGGEQAALAGQGLLFRSGTVVVLLHDAAELLPDNGATVLVHEAGPLKALQQQLTAVLPKNFGPRGQPPLVPTLLPEHGLLAGTVRYALGPEGYAAMGGPLPVNVIGFDKAAEVATAEYNVHGSRGMLSVLLYPTPQIAAQQGRAIEAAANADRAKYGSTLKMRRDGILVAMGWGELSGAEADALIKSANLHEEFSWNQALQSNAPDFNLEVHKTASLLENIVVLSSVLGAGAILLGIFLGFGRAWFRVLMGKPAAVEQEFLSINLRAIPPGVLDGHPEGRGPGHPGGS